MIKLIFQFEDIKNEFCQTHQKDNKNQINKKGEKCIIF